jgi:hypothetical protein
MGVGAVVENFGEIAENFAERCSDSRLGCNRLLINLIWRDLASLFAIADVGYRRFGEYQLEPQRANRRQVAGTEDSVHSNLSRR